MAAKDQSDEDIIYRAWAQGVSEMTLASSYRKSIDDVKAIINARLSTLSPPSEMNPEEVLLVHKVRLDALLDELARVAARETGQARVRALTTRFEVLRHQLMIDQKTGVLPNDLGKLAIYLDYVRLAKNLREILGRHPHSEEVLRELREVLPPGPDDDAH